MSEQVYLKDYDGPLYAYVDFRIGDTNVIYTTMGGSVTDTYDLDHVSDYEKGDTYISNVVMSLAYTKNTTTNVGGHSWGIGEEFNISVFDESAVYVEDIIANAITSTFSSGVNCYVEYGWAANGKRIEERSNGFEGIIKSYTISFEGSSTVLSVNGTSSSSTSMSTTYPTSEDIPNDVTSTGNPSEIVKWICENVLNKESNVTYKFDETTIDETEPVYLNDSEIKNLVCNNTSIFSYIKNELCPVAKSVDGRGGYIFYILEDENDESVNWVYFKASGNINQSFNVGNEENEEVLNVGAVSEITQNVVREYVYYVGAEQGEVLSWSVDHEYMVGDANPGVTYTIDNSTNELIACKTKNGNAKVMGLSSGAYNTLSQCMQDLWTKYASQEVNASLEILGDANINAQERVKVYVYTKYNLLHHTTGIYLVTGIEDNVDSSGFITSLTLQKEPDMSTFETEIIQEGYEPDTDLTERGYPSSTEGYKKTGSENEVLDPPEGASPIVSNEPVEPGNTGGGSKSTKSGNTGSVNTVGKKSVAGEPSSGDPKGESNVASPIVYDK